MTALAVTWPGPFKHEARAMYLRARESGMSLARSMSLAVIASFKQGWIFRQQIAKHIGADVRTVQRGITQGKELGLLGTARAKKGEIPPGLTSPLDCGWSHRWVIGWGQAYEQAKAAIEQSRLTRLLRHTTQRVLVRAHRREPMTAEQIDAELERTQRERDDPNVLMPEPAAKRRMSPEEIDAELERIARARGQPP